MSAPLPLAEELAGHAGQILPQWTADAQWAELTAAARLHLIRWTTMTGTQVIDRLDLASDAGPLLDEAARALAMSAAAVQHRGPDLAHQLAFPWPVQEAIDALLVQADLLRAVTARSGARPAARTPVHVLDYHHACLTHDVYTAAWGEPPARYWLSSTIVAARRTELLRRFASIGVRLGEGHQIPFDVADPRSGGGRPL